MEFDCDETFLYFSTLFLCSPQCTEYGRSCTELGALTPAKPCQAIHYHLFILRFSSNDLSCFCQQLLALQLTGAQWLFLTLQSDNNNAVG